MYHPIVPFRCPKDLLTRLGRVARNLRANRSEAIRRAIEEFCDAQEKEEHEAGSARP